MEEENNIVQLEQREGIKLIRNASGIYQWEIKTLDIDVKKSMSINDEIISELEKRGLKYFKEDKK